ncbi:MAG TPA: DUF1801 domain-containing protein [Caldilineaceae bacterium]|nr:DUF1801 domain-containing protein [Caldilineaceae bacterium]
MNNSPTEQTPSERISDYIAALDDWRGPLAAQLRTLIHAAAPELTEEWKWETPVFAHKGNVMAIGVFKDHVKLNFLKGATVADPQGLFNAGLEAKASRAIDFHEDDDINEPALRDLVQAAVAQNSVKKSKKG